MKTWFMATWENLRTSFWFIPTLMAVFFGGLAFVTIAIDERVPITFAPPFNRLNPGRIESVREILSTIVGSIITVMSVVFSITIVTLTLAASQFGPRLMRNFMRDRGNQTVLGIFISTFVYCLLLLQMVEGINGRHPNFVPNVSLLVALMLTFTSLAVLIYFIHHMAKSIQAPYLIASVTHNLHRAIDAFYPTILDGSVDRSTVSPHVKLRRQIECEGSRVGALHAGYVQAIDYEALRVLAVRRDLIICMHRRPGDFIVQNATLARIWPMMDVDEELQARINHCVLIGAHRTDTQDIEFEVLQLVEVGLRAMSPSLNDPFTAINCIDQLGGALAHLAGRQFPPSYLEDDDGSLRVIADRTSYTGIVNAAFNQLRQASLHHPAVMIRMLETISQVAEHVRTEEQRSALAKQAHMVRGEALRIVEASLDRQNIEARFRVAMQRLRQI